MKLVPASTPLVPPDASLQATSTLPFVQSLPPRRSSDLYLPGSRLLNDQVPSFAVVVVLNGASWLSLSITPSRSSACSTQSPLRSLYRLLVMPEVGVFSPLSCTPLALTSSSLMPFTEAGF